MGRGGREADKPGWEGEAALARATDCYIAEIARWGRKDINRLFSLVYFVGGSLLNSFVFSKTKLCTQQWQAVHCIGR